MSNGKANEKVRRGGRALVEWTMESGSTRSEFRVMSATTKYRVRREKSTNSGGRPQQRHPHPHIRMRLEPQSLRHDNAFTFCHAQHHKQNNWLSFPRYLCTTCSRHNHWQCGLQVFLHSWQDVLNFGICVSVRCAVITSRYLPIATQAPGGIYALSKYSLILIVFKSKWFFSDYYEFMMHRVYWIHPPPT